MRWRDYSVVMQSAMNALNPMKSIGAQFKDTLQAHGSASGDEIRHAVGGGHESGRASTPPTSRATRTSSAGGCASGR